MCHTQSRLDACIYYVKISVTLYPDGAGFKIKGCCGLWWCYSNYWLVGVKWKEEMVVGMMTESKAKSVYPSQQLTQSWVYEQPLLLLAPIADEKCLVWFQLQSMLYTRRSNTHMLKQYETWDVSETRNIQIQLVISISPWQNWSCWMLFYFIIIINNLSTMLSRDLLYNKDSFAKLLSK